MQFNYNINLSYVLSPEKGYKIERAEFTTFTLAPDKLRLIAGAILKYNLGYNDSKNQPTTNRIIRKSKEDISKYFHVF